MFHNMGEHFSSMSDVREKIGILTTRWNARVAPAIVHLAEESGHVGPRSADLNGMHND